MTQSWRMLHAVFLHGGTVTSRVYRNYWSTKGRNMRWRQESSSPAHIPAFRAPDLENFARLFPAGRNGHEPRFPELLEHERQEYALATRIVVASAYSCLSCS